SHTDRIQRRLKPFFVEKRLMLGEFYPGNQSPGLHNPDFRPLQSPVPMLVIRSMTEPDLPFLSRTSDAPAVRIKFLESYVKQMSILGHSSRLAEAYQALGEAHQELNGGQVEASGSKCPVKRLENVIKQTVVQTILGAKRWLHLGHQAWTRTLPRLLGRLTGAGLHL
ncbi:MAG: DUF6875 domain-containing protein, partial [Cyanobacteria bacterium J06642_11]